MFWGQHMNTYIMPVNRSVRSGWHIHNRYRYRSGKKWTGYIYATKISIVGGWCGCHLSLCGQCQFHSLCSSSGTREVLRLVTTHPSASIPVHFISTLSVLSSSSSRRSGYAHTKWMAESPINQAIQAGLSAKIYRLGLIGPHSRLGIGNPRDLYTARMRMHCYPSILRHAHLTVLTMSVEGQITPLMTFISPAKDCIISVWFGYDDDQEIIRL